MALSLTSSGVRSTTGRGSARVTLDISFDSLIKWAKRNAVDTEQLMNRSFGRAASGLKSQLRRAMAKGGDPSVGIPMFKAYDEFTTRYRTARGTIGKMGGRLAEKNNIVAFKRGGWQVIGWPDGLADVAVAFQDAVGSKKDPFTDPKTRAYYHRVVGRDVPNAYIHNPRPVLTPFAEHIEKHLEEWAKGAFYKELARQMMKGSK